MGCVEGLSCVKSDGRKQLRSLFWRLKAALKKAAAKKTTKKHHLTFQYDPSSYALNFDDDGCCKHAKPLHFCSDDKNIQWVYVVWVEL
ncbi:hypothetical protein TIFTF001_020027 [Ficus carica]|uniref:Uncharacterized protein n=1 Tax=Ficus carica TaxID=3494 RepID=A0AA88AHH4_FICCA|nr:hypothetical protein TIFTF001_020027 [Ficus carica]